MEQFALGIRSFWLANAYNFMVADKLVLKQFALGIRSCWLAKTSANTFKVADQKFDFKLFALGIRSCWLAYAYNFMVADQNFDFKQFALGIRSCWLANAYTSFMVVFTVHNVDYEYSQEFCQTTVFIP